MTEFNFRDGPKEVKVGDEVLLDNCNFGTDLQVITKIGTKLMTLSDGNVFYFDGTERSDYSHNAVWSSTVWSSKGCYSEHKRKLDTVASIRKIIDKMHRNNVNEISLYDLQTVLGLLEVKG